MFHFGLGDVYWNLWVDRLRRSFSGTAKWHLQTWQNDAINLQFVVEKEQQIQKKIHISSWTGWVMSVVLNLYHSEVLYWIFLAGFCSAGWPVADTSEMPKVCWCQLTHVFLLLNQLDNPSTEVTNASLAQFSPGPGPGLVGISGIPSFLMLSVEKRFWKVAGWVCYLKKQKASIRKKKTQAKTDRNLSQVFLTLWISWRHQTLTFQPWENWCGCTDLLVSFWFWNILECWNADVVLSIQSQLSSDAASKLRSDYFVSALAALRGKQWPINPSTHQPMKMRAGRQLHFNFFFVWGGA